MIDKRKTLNNLASLVDRQAAAGTSLPQTLQNQIKQLTKYTNEFKQILADGLPQEILDTLWVVKYDKHILTLSVITHTAANHLRYLSSSLIPLIQEQSATFKQLNSINVIVSHAMTKQSLTGMTERSLQVIQQKELIDNSHVKPLSTNARETIAHTANHVTSDEKLKQALIKLANSDT